MSHSSDPSVAAGITVGIVTCNRDVSLERCVRSLARLGTLVRQVIVIDNGSSCHVSEWLPARVVNSDLPVQIVRLTGYLGPITARNKIAEMATCEYILSLDDDTEILDASAVWQAIAVFKCDPNVASVAFAQATANGEKWPAPTQPAPVDYPCVTTAFIGCAVLLRRSAFLELGGYFELLDFYGEEKEFCLRLLHAKRVVVYLPHATIAHLADPAGRNLQKYYRYYTRNDCFTAIRNYPAILAILVTVQRLMGYHRNARRHLQLYDPNGRQWLWSELLRCHRQLRQERRSLGWRTIFRWQTIKKRWPKYAIDKVEVSPAFPTTEVATLHVEAGN